MAMRILTIMRGVIYLGISGDEWLRRRWNVTDCEPRGAELVKSAQLKSANRTDFAALPVAA